jgi:hypothetical protein
VSDQDGEDGTPALYRNGVLQEKWLLHNIFVSVPAFLRRHS